MNNNKNKNLIIAIITIIVGILMIVYKEGVMSWLMTAIGVVWLIDGILDLVQNHLPKTGIVKIIIGVIVIVFGWVLLSVILIIAGACLIIYGIYMLYNLIRMKTKALTTFQTIGLYITPIVYIICGGLLCFAQKSTTETIVLIVGILLLVNGILNIIKVLKK